MRVGSLFSGIGGLDLGLERAGMEVVWQVENDEFCQRVLAWHWPDVARFRDVRDCHALPPVDLIAGGFPCQEISRSGVRTGLAGKHSGLWTEFARIIRQLRPRFVLVENVPEVLVRGAGIILSDLAASGYDAEWDCLPAAAFGAPHLRAREWILAYPRGFRDGKEDTIFAGRAQPSLRTWWDAEPGVAVLADGLSDRLAVRGLGNAVVPQVAEHVGRLIMEGV